MPYKFTYTNDRFYCIFTGLVTWDDVFAAMGNLYGNSKLESIKEILIVFSEASHVVLTKKNAQELAYLDRVAIRYNSNLNFAFVASNPDAQNLATMYIRYSRELKVPWNYRIFDNLTKATNWLDGQKETEGTYKDQYF